MLYPAVDRVLGAPGATATMAADHREIARRIHALGAAVLGGEGPAPSPDALESLRAQLYGLSAILHLHFAKEEDVLLPVLDDNLDAQQAGDLFAAMAGVAHADREPAVTHHG